MLLDSQSVRQYGHLFLQHTASPAIFRASPGKASIYQLPYLFTHSGMRRCSSTNRTCIDHGMSSSVILIGKASTSYLILLRRHSECGMVHRHSKCEKGANRRPARSRFVVNLCTLGSRMEKQNLRQSMCVDHYDRLWRPMLLLILLSVYQMHRR